MKTTKARRQQLIVRLLERHAVTNQAQLANLLRAAGITATQATISRDLEDVGATKVRAPGGHTVYAVPHLPHAQHAPEDHLRRVLGEWVVDIAHSGNIVVVRTPPGCAHVVASALDRASVDGAIGTVAGDDTLLIVAAATTSGGRLASRLSQLAGVTGASAARAPRRR